MKKIIYWIIGITAIILTIILIVSGNRPEFFDIFGLIIFSFLFVIGMWMLRSKKRLPDWTGFFILLVGILGLIVDGYIVVKTFLLGG